ncbi:GNAT family N-acetyltransferase [Pseudoalteromonas sp. SMS1]|uniref:GNAT family N-acetyltransferase n=1 Tax=Pseudoalteromonas sp. SMS1 TaxID=2908894 RepID=UPI001F2A8965|nr:GNAT family N-acetyltransferase [Pseudoalteromonas sp. SMS1]MCF2856955.1 GNAT family N-acetyltransferase [Pseudoalteromonas sp. SMS1]
MIEIKPAQFEHIDAFVTMEQADNTSTYIIPYSKEMHFAEMHKEDIVYLSVFDQGVLAGFMILACESNHSVEFRRIVIASKGNGVGQKAIYLMEAYCVKQLCCQRIWLDVFESNLRGIHIYKKLGYQPFDDSSHMGKKLILMEKELY